MKVIYDQIIEKLFFELYNKDKTKTTLYFSRDDLERVINDLDLSVRNIPDIKYSYDARRDFPDAIKKVGNWAIIGRGKGKYSFINIKKPNLIKMPDDILSHVSEYYSIGDLTPPIVSSVLGDDEQATLSRVQYSEIIKKIFGFTSAHRVQGHKRTTVSTGQVEIDEVYVAKKHSKKFVLPISAKGIGDNLSYTQIVNLTLYVEKDFLSKGYINKPIGLYKDSSYLYFVEFSPHRRVDQISISNAVCVRLD